MSDQPAGRGWMDPYLAGIGIGLVMLMAFVLVGRGLGASGAFSAVVTAGVAAASEAASPAAAPASDGYFAASAAAQRGGLLRDWLVIEIIGVTLGALVSALLAGRARLTIERGAGVSGRRRLVWAVAGGVLMGVGAKLARGCTSGQALTGGALLSVGSWLFVVAAFAAAYLVAPLALREWR